MPKPPRPRVPARVMAERRTRCQHCNGQGRHLTYASGVVVCRACDGTGRTDGAGA